MRAAGICHRLTLVVVVGLASGRALAADATPARQLAVAGKLDVDLHADIMVARGEWDVAMNWYNCGVTDGTFGNFAPHARGDVFK